MGTTPTTITIEIDPAQLASTSDEMLATYWHVAQANPADGFQSKQPGDLAEQIGREIIRRWLRKVPPALHHHQGRHYYWKQLTQFARYEPGGPAGSAEWEQGQWVPKAPDADQTTDGGGA